MNYTSTKTEFKTLHMLIFKSYQYIIVCRYSYKHTQKPVLNNRSSNLSNWPLYQHFIHLKPSIKLPLTPNPAPEHSVHLFHRKYFSKTAAILIILSIICCTDPKAHGKKHAGVIAHGIVKTMSCVKNSFRFSWHKMLILATLINTCPVLVMSYRQGQHQLSHHLTDMRPILI